MSSGSLTMLMIYCDEGHIDGVRHILLKNPKAVQEQNSNGATPLFYAVKHGNNKIAELLLGTQNIDINLTNNARQTTLFVACSYGQHDCAKLLLQNGADPNIPDQRGWTPLIAAAHNGDVKTATLLITKGADKLIKDSFGKTALERAKTPEVKAVLRSPTLEREARSVSPNGLKSCLSPLSEIKSKRRITFKLDSKKIIDDDELSPMQSANRSLRENSEDEDGAVIKEVTNGLKQELYQSAGHRIARLLIRENNGFRKELDAGMEKGVKLLEDRLSDRLHITLENHGYTSTKLSAESGRTTTATTTRSLSSLPTHTSTSPSISPTRKLPNSQTISRLNEEFRKNNRSNSPLRFSVTTTASSRKQMTPEFTKRVIEQFKTNLLPILEKDIEEKVMSELKEYKSQIKKEIEQLFVLMGCDIYTKLEDKMSQILEKAEKISTPTREHNSKVPAKSNMSTVDDKLGIREQFEDKGYLSPQSKKIVYAKIDVDSHTVSSRGSQEKSNRESSSNFTFGGSVTESSLQINDPKSESYKINDLTSSRSLECTFKPFDIGVFSPEDSSPKVDTKSKTPVITLLSSPKNGNSEENETPRLGSSGAKTFDFNEQSTTKRTSPTTNGKKTLSNSKSAASISRSSAVPLFQKNTQQTRLASSMSTQSLRKPTNKQLQPSPNRSTTHRIDISSDLTGLITTPCRHQRLAVGAGNNPSNRDKLNRLIKNRNKAVSSNATTNTGGGFSAKSGGSPRNSKGSPRMSPVHTFSDLHSLKQIGSKTARAAVGGGKRKLAGVSPSINFSSVTLGQVERSQPNSGTNASVSTPTKSRARVRREDPGRLALCVKHEPI